MKTLSAILPFLISIQCALAQGEYLQRGEDAYGVTFSAGSGSSADVFGTSIAYSASGTFDAGFSYSFILSKRNAQDVSSLSRAAAPFASIHVLKQDEKYPISISLHTSIELQHFIVQDVRTSATHVFYGGSVFRNLSISPDLFIQPTFSTSLSNLYSTDHRPDQQFVMIYECSASIVLATSEQTKFIIRPAGQFSRDHPFFSASFCFLGISEAGRNQ